MSAFDLTERKRFEERLIESEHLFRAVFDSSMDAILIAGDKGACLDANASACALFGLSKEELIGRSAREFAESDSGFDQVWKAFLEKGTLMGEFRLVRADGAVRELEFSATANILAGRHLWVLRDITHRKHLEGQFRQSQKMEAVGRLAGGIAHDFNNLLTAILGYSQLALSRLDQNSDLATEIGEVEKAARRAASLTGQLLAFSRKQVLQPKVLDLNEVVSSLENMLRRVIGEDIQLAAALAPDLNRVKADPGLIDQVIMNLIVNARDAMPRGGKIIIETANVQLDERYAPDHIDVRSGPYVLLAVSDTGAGMDRETQSRIFEPFFTTKQQGTGLGLSTVYGIVKQSGGHIWVYSEPDHGTTFKMYLPAVGQASEASAQDQQRANLARGTETLLLVEDEPLVRGLASSVLRGLNYSVLEAASGEEALKVCEKHPHRIDLLLTDIVMPNMSGRMLAGIVKLVMPHIRVLFISGYTYSAIADQELLEQGMAFLQKPFTPELLAQKVREVLDSPPEE